MLSAWIAVAATAAGLLLGSFLNVCIARLPGHRSIAWPGSHCPRCTAPIRPWDNVPLLSFALLRGRCRDCGERISLRYPLVEAGLAGLFLASAARFHEPRNLVEAAALCFLLLGLLVMDAETLLLPDSFTLPGLALGLLSTIVPGGGLPAVLRLTADAPFPLPHWPGWLAGLLGALGGAGALLLVRWLYWLARRREGMGLGDVKLAAMLGAWIGPAGVALSMVLGVLLAALAGLVLLRKGLSGRTRLPLGSFLCAAALLTLFTGRSILTWYFSFWR